MKYLLIILLTLSFTSCGLIQKFRKTEWTVAETIQWSEQMQQSAWKGYLLYQGSDSLKHYFISRYMDEFVWFEILQTELTIDEIHPNKGFPKGTLGYYYVDPKQNFMKIVTDK